MTAPLKNTVHQLSDEQCAVAVRQRIGAPLFDDLPRTCACGDRIDTREQHGHVHWCKKTKAASTALRHNLVVTALANIARSAGITARIELTQPTFSAVLDKQRKTRPDLVLVGSYGTYIVDVSVCHPTTPGARLPLRPGDTVLRQIEHYEGIKISKYRATAAQHGAEFIPFSCDVFGAMGEHAHRLVEWFLKEAAINGVLGDSSARAPFRANVYNQLSVAIQRAAAAGAADAARRIRRAPAPRLSAILNVDRGAPVHV